MFKYNGQNSRDLGLQTEFDEIALNTDSTEEMFELLKIEHPFINRLIANNKNLTEEVMMEMLNPNHVAYTMCVNIAQNPNITDKVKEKLYDVSNHEYKDSKLKEDLNLIFKK